MFRNSNFFLTLLFCFVFGVQAATFRETKLICQTHIKKLFKMEPDGEEDTKVLATIIEQGERVSIVLETADFFLGIRNFNLKENEVANVYSEIGSWVATREVKGLFEIEDLKIDRHSGFIIFSQNRNNFSRSGVGQCEKVNSNANKF